MNGLLRNWKHGFVSRISVSCVEGFWDRRDLYPGLAHFSSFPQNAKK